MTFGDTPPDLEYVEYLGDSVDVGMCSPDIAVLVKNFSDGTTVHIRLDRSVIDELVNYLDDKGLLP